MTSSSGTMIDRRIVSLEPTRRRQAARDGWTASQPCVSTSGRSVGRAKQAPASPAGERMLLGDCSSEPRDPIGTKATARPVPRVVPQLVHKQKATRTRSRLLLLPVALLARGQLLVHPADVSSLIDHCYFGRRSGVVDPAASAGIAARAGPDSRLQPVKQEPLKSGATLLPTFHTTSDAAASRDASIRGASGSERRLLRAGPEQSEQASCRPSYRRLAPVVATRPAPMPSLHSATSSHLAAPSSVAA